MKNKIFITLFFIFIAKVSYGQDSLTSFNGSIVKQIRDSIARANHCEVKEDCVEVQLGCPFGCNIYVHKDEVTMLEQAVQESNRSSSVRCEYTCAPSFIPNCINHQCVANDSN